MPQNAMIGDQSYDLPVTQIDEEQLTIEKNMSKFSKSIEYQKLKEHLEQRIQYYKTFLPNGESVLTKTMSELGQQWVIANAITAEFKAFCDA